MMPRLLVLLAVVALGGLCATGCGDGPQLAGEWVLAGVEDSAGSVPLIDGESARLRIDAGTINGGTGCNSFSGRVTFDGDASSGSVRFDEVGVTEMACLEPGRMELERRFTAILFTIDRYLVGDDTLTLSGSGGELRYAVRVPPDPSALVGTDWTLDTV